MAASIDGDGDGADRGAGAQVQPEPEDAVGRAGSGPEQYGHEDDAQYDGAVDRGTGAQVRELFVLHDPNCPLCRAVVAWLVKQRTLVPLGFVPAGSAEAAHRFPGLDHGETLREITVVSDRGDVYTGAEAWIAVLWALAAHRGLSYRLATPLGRPMARAAVLAAARIRSATAGGPDDCGETCGPAG